VGSCLEELENTLKLLEDSAPLAALKIVRAAVYSDYFEPRKDEDVSLLRMPYFKIVGGLQEKLDVSEAEAETLKKQVGELGSENSLLREKLEQSNQRTRQLEKEAALMAREHSVANERLARLRDDAVDAIDDYHAMEELYMQAAEKNRADKQNIQELKGELKSLRTLEAELQQELQKKQIMLQNLESRTFLRDSLVGRDRTESSSSDTTPQGRASASRRSSLPSTVGMKKDLPARRKRRAVRASLKVAVGERRRTESHSPMLSPHTAKY